MCYPCLPNLCLCITDMGSCTSPFLPSPLSVEWLLLYSQERWKGPTIVSAPTAGRGTSASVGWNKVSANGCTSDLKHIKDVFPLTTASILLKPMIATCHPSFSEHSYSSSPSIPLPVPPVLSGHHILSSPPSSLFQAFPPHHKSNMSPSSSSTRVDLLWFGEVLPYQIHFYPCLYRYKYKVFIVLLLLLLLLLLLYYYYYYYYYY